MSRSGPFTDAFKNNRCFWHLIERHKQVNQRGHKNRGMKAEDSRSRQILRGDKTCKNQVKRVEPNRTHIQRKHGRKQARAAE